MSEIGRIPVGVVVERRKARSQWIDHIWQPVTALPGLPETAPWTVLKEEGDTTTFYAGAGEIELFPTDTAYYRDNLATAEPLLWVALRPSKGEWPYELFKVTADPREGEAMTEAGSDLIETVQMPQPIAAEIAAFVARYHVERPFVKRKRDHADREAMSRGGRVKDGR